MVVIARWAHLTILGTLHLQNSEEGTNSPIYELTTFNCSLVTWHHHSVMLHVCDFGSFISEALPADSCSDMRLMTP